MLIVIELLPRDWTCESNYAVRLCHKWQCSVSLQNITGLLP